MKPFPSSTILTSSRPRALVVVAHSDDEALGCGGTIAKLAAAGWEVGVVFMTDGVSARLDSSGDQAGIRAEASSKALTVLGAQLLRGFDFPDNQMDTVSLLRTTRAVEEVAREFKPQVVLTHHANDLNVDHRRAHQAVITAFRPMPSSEVEALLCFEVPSSTGWNSSALPSFNPTLSVDISDTFESKLKALKCYDAEMRDSPHPRSAQMVEALARYRGSLAGLALAEAFEVQMIRLGMRASALLDLRDLRWPQINRQAIE